MTDQPITGTEQLARDIYSIRNTDGSIDLYTPSGEITLTETEFDQLAIAWLTHRLNTLTQQFGINPDT